MFAGGKAAVPINWISNDGVIHAWATGYDTPFIDNRTYDWSTLYNDLAGQLATINAGAPGPRTITVYTTGFEIHSGGSSTNLGYLFQFTRTFTVRGTGAIGTTGSPPSSGTITYAQILNNTRGWNITGLEFDPRTL